MRRLDPRLYQIAALTLLLGYGVFILRFDVTLGRAAATVATALATQAACARLWKIAFDPRSAMISGLSLSLLLRSDSLLLMLAAAVAAIAGKFIVRRRGKHVFNPTNGAIVLMLLASNRVWVSPGQWGTAAFATFLLLCLGGLVVNRAARGDVTLAFMAAWSAIVIGRSLFLGDPFPVPLHRLESGALLIFTFFMISDPKTTPDSRTGRIVFAACVAAVAGYIEFNLFRTNGVLWALAAAAPAVPFLDALFPARRYHWPARPARPAKGDWSCASAPSF